MYISNFHILFEHCLYLPLVFLLSSSCQSQNLMPMSSIVRRTVLEDMTQPILMMTKKLHRLGESMVRYVGGEAGDPGLRYRLHEPRRYPYNFHNSEYRYVSSIG
jgi:hypothetical protein